mgnify:CR=1 FL=1
MMKTSEIKEQRVQFEQLSIHLTKAVQEFGVGEEVYQQFCPMANKNKGAYWLSVSKKIKNPYFGEVMLTCGEVSKIIE